jgi:hypothetical protein
MNLKHVRSLLVSVLPLSLPLFAACNAPLTESAAGLDTGEESVGAAAQAIQAATGWPMPNPGTSLPNPASYTTSDGHVVDNVTGLWWQGVAGCAAGCTQVDAAAYCEGLTLDGSSDWRLPTRIELVSIVDYTKHNAAIDPTYFPGTLTHAYWTSTAMVFFPNASNHFKVGGSEGNTAYGGSGLNGARCVRAPAAAPASQLVILADGTVLDTGTGLAWQQAAGAETYTQGEAIAHCAGLGAGFRLPSMKELQTIVDDTRTFPAIDPTAFPGTLTDVAYWTSTPVSWQQVPNAWHVGFDLGQTNHDLASAAYHARCVADDHACFIAGTAYAAGTANPGNACQVCSPALSRSAWSNQANGTGCDDGDANTVGDVCTGGTCAGVDHCLGVTCPAPDQCHDAGLCDHATGACSNPAKPDGDACGTDQACVSGTCGTASVTIRRHCNPTSVILETIPAASCVNFSAATISSGPSFATLNGAGWVTIYEGSDCTGGFVHVSTDTNFCGTHWLQYDNGDEVNDNARSIAFH